MSRPIDASFLGCQDPALETIEIEDEALVLDPSSGDRVPLNGTAALIWACLDGEGTVGEISADLAEGLEIPYEAVLRDVIAAVSGFVDRAIAYDATDAPPEHTAREEHRAAFLDSDFPADAGFTVGVGDTHVRVQANDAELRELLDAVLAPLADDAPAQSEITIASTPTRGRVLGLHHLYRDGTLEFRCTDRTRMARAVAAWLDAFLPPEPGTVRLEANLLVSRNKASLFAGSFREILDLADRRLARAGWGMADAPVTVVDRLRLTAIVQRPRLDVVLPAPTGKVLPPGEYAITDVVLVGSEPDPARLAAPAQKVAALLPLLAEPGRPVPPDDVEWLWTVAQRAECQWITGFDEHELLDTIDRMAGRTPRPSTPLPR